MDIMRHGADVEVVSPKPLREKIIAQIARALRVYDKI